MTTPNNPYDKNSGNQDGGSFPQYGDYQHPENDPQYPTQGQSQYHTDNNQQYGNNNNNPAAPAYPNQGGYQQQGAGYQYGDGSYDSQFAQDNRKNGVALAALIFGILSLLMVVTFIFGVFAVIPGIIGLILGLVGLGKAKKINGPGRRKGMAITGIILSVLAIVGSAFMIFAFGSLGSQAIQDCDGLSGDAFSQCVTDSITNQLGVENVN